METRKEEKKSHETQEQKLQRMLDDGSIWDMTPREILNWTFSCGRKVNTHNGLL